MLAGILTKVVSKTLSAGLFAGKQTKWGTEFVNDKSAKVVKAMGINPPPRLLQYSKNLAKFGKDGMKPDGTKPIGIEKALLDKRVSHLVAPPFKLDVKEAITELPTDKHLQYNYLFNLLYKVKKKDDVRAVIQYVKSVAANNLTPDQRAKLMMSAMDKLKYIDTVRQFLH